MPCSRRQHRRHAADHQRPALLLLLRLRGDQNRHDDMPPAPGVEILQIERVILDLQQILREHRILPGFELQHDDGERRDEHGIDPPPEPPHREFEHHAPGAGVVPAAERRAQHLDRDSPGSKLLALIRPVGSYRLVGKRLHERFGRPGEEVGDRQRDHGVIRPGFARPRKAARGLPPCPPQPPGLSPAPLRPERAWWNWQTRQI